MERPPGSSSRLRNGCHTLAQALLYAEQEVEAHVDLLRGAFEPAPAKHEVAQVAALTLTLTELRPPPRLRALRDRLRESALLREWFAKCRFVLSPTAAVPHMRRWPGTEAVPILETVGDLARWLRVDVPYLYWLADLGDRNRRSNDTALQHYTVQTQAKRDGSVRVVEAPKQMLRHAQRQILHELLDRVEVHEAVHGFRRGRSIRTFAEPHVGKAMVLRLDLSEFFPSVSGPRVGAMFRTLGYPEHVADLLGGLCTTTTPDAAWNTVEALQDRHELPRLRQLYRRPHLPQGAPTSPAVANLCALQLDGRLAGIARAAGAA